MWIAEEAVDLRYAVGLKSAMPKIGDRCHAIGIEDQPSGPLIFKGKG